MKQGVWITGLDREVWIGLDRRSGSGVWIACGFWGLIRTLNFEVQPYILTRVELSVSRVEMLFAEIPCLSSQSLRQSTIARLTLAMLVEIRFSSNNTSGVKIHGKPSPTTRGALDSIELLA